eukprot:4922968-Pyramimonas_sp.AAC.1
MAVAEIRTQEQELLEPLRVQEEGRRLHPGAHLSKKQQAIADSVLELPYSISRDHESLGLPPEDPDMGKLWTRSLRQRLGR